MLSPAAVLRLQATVGNHAVARLLNPHPVVQRKIVSIGSEKVKVDSTLGILTKKGKAQRAEAERIITAIKDTYGIELSSPTLLEGIKNEYVTVPEKVRKSLRTRHWTMVELGALETALKHFAPILGGKRAGSTRSGMDQEVTAVGKARNAIDEDTPAAELDKDTLGEFFETKKVMGLFKSSEKNTQDFPTLQEQLVGTFVHETAHGLLAYAYDDFVKATDGFWLDQNTESGVAGAEAPITEYGTTNACEDLCESAMFYFVAPQRLKNGLGAAHGQHGNPAPKRFAFMQKIGNDWLPPVKDAPVLVPGPPQKVPTPDAKVPSGVA